ncbi:MAG TPA: TRAP transporter large permease subunit [Candidatus Mailhella excrementigallinarum]|nr:MAG: C4-dicarboxylate ABC transporter substrate-binding protein [Desulfovibrionaceae bacterium]HIV66437.1 TRAP transporter large permease subunit [Candidatus Mailhella excrementigallinarum]
MTTPAQISDAGKHSLLRLLDENFEKPFLVIALLLSISLITYQVLFRYIATDLLGMAGSTAEVEELAIYSFIWLSYLSIPLAIKNRSNIRITILFDALPPRWRNILWVIDEGVFLVFAVVLAWLCARLSGMQLRFPQYTPANGMSYFWPYLVLPIGFGLMALRLLQNLIRQVRITGFRDSLIAVAMGVTLSAPIWGQWDIGIIAALAGTMFLCLLLGVPIAVALAFSAMAALYNSEFLNVSTMAPTSFAALDSFTIMAIFFFVAAGVFMGCGGISRQLVDLADLMVGRRIGGMAMATVITCMFFAAICGSGPATVAAIGAITIPAMVERGYDKRFAAALVAAAGSIGVMIPPSNPMVVYGVLAKASIGKLFMGGIIPGVLTGAVLMGYSYWLSRRNGWRGTAEKVSFSRKMKVIWEAKWALLVPVIILGGIYGGYMTPTEAAAISAMYGLLVGMFVYRGINRHNFFSVCVECCTTSAVIIFLIAMASSFGYLLALEQVPESIAKFILSLSGNRVIVLLCINIFLLIVGALMEPAAATIILTPILAPVAVKLGVDVVHFGIIMTVNLAIGFVTPPVGSNLFVASATSGLRLEDIARAALPMIAGMILLLMAITYIPAISLILPNTMM